MTNAVQASNPNVATTQLNESQNALKPSTDGPYELNKGYEIDFADDTKYHVKIGLSKLKKLKITVTELSKYNNIYESKFDHDELIHIDKFFGLFDKIEDIVEELDNLFTKNLISISLDMSHNVVMEIQISINNKPRVIRLKLIKRGSEQIEALNNLVLLVSEQTKKLDNLQKENTILKEKVGKLNEKLDDLQNNPVQADGGFLKPSVREESDSDFGKKKKKKNDDDSDEDSSDKKKKKKKKQQEEFDIDKIIDGSKIITDMKDVDFIIKKINNNLLNIDKEFQNMKILYSATVDGDSPTIFHSYCDGICPVLVFIKTTKKKRFGGYTEASFESSKVFKGKKDDNAFIFSIDKLKTYDVEEGQNAICAYKNYGPVFYGYEYCNIYLIGNFLSNNGNVAKKGDRYKTTEDFELNGGKQKFLTQELEVYQVILKNVGNDDEDDDDNNKDDDDDF